MIQKTELFSAPIVVGVDASETSQRALATAIELARHLHCHLVVVSAYRRLHDSKTRFERRDAPADVAFRLHGDSAVQTVLDEARELAQDGGVAFECIAREGAPASVLVDVATELHAGLIIVGNRGMRGRGRLKGSVPNDVSHSAPCSVLIVDTAGFVAA
jgi:nucleotide-binding universal stress UspA family protein